MKEENKEYQKVRFFTTEERTALVKKTIAEGKAKVEEFVITDPVASYFQLKEIQLMLDRAICEIANQFMPLAGVWVKLDEFKYEKCARDVQEAQRAIKDANIKLTQVLSRFGGEVYAAYKVVHPEAERECPNQDLENTKSE